MNSKNLHKFMIEVWFDALPGDTKLGAVTVYAETEKTALDLAHAHTHYLVSGVDDTIWHIKEMHKQVYCAV